MAITFKEKFEEALAERQLEEPEFGLRTIARALAKGDVKDTETIRRRLIKYRRPKKPGGAAVVPTTLVRREIEKAMGLPLDALKPEPLEPAERMIQVLLPSSVLRGLIREEMSSVA